MVSSNGLEFVEEFKYLTTWYITKKDVCRGEMIDIFTGLTF